MPQATVKEVTRFIEDNVDEMARDYITWLDNPRGFIAPGSMLAIARDMYPEHGVIGLPFIVGVLMDRVIRKYVEKLP